MVSVVLQNARVDFPIYGAQRSLRTAIFQRATGGLIHREGKNQERVVVRALNDVSLHLDEGDRLGLIGHNGSGKSTLLKVLAGIYQPISGKLLVNGRVTPLFDMMPGLDVEDTGYENIFTAGMLLGMSRDDLDARIEGIEEFCELGEYLTLPVRTYSMGMTMRLGFAVVTALDPGILLMDEAFGTGDLRFAERAEARLNEFIGRSRIMVLASHSDQTIRSMCNKAIIMEQGRIIASGPVEEICDRYNETVHKATVKEEQTRRSERAKSTRLSIPEEVEKGWLACGGSIEDLGLEDRLNRTSGAARLTKITAHDVHGNPRWNFLPGETATFRFEYRILRRIEDLAILLRLNVVSAHDGAHEIVFAEMREVLSSEPIEGGYEGVVELSFKVPDLLPSRYSPYAWLGRISNLVGYDVVDANVGLPAFEVRPSTEHDLRGGILLLAHEAKKRIAKQREMLKVG